MHSDTMRNWLIAVVMFIGGVTVAAAPSLPAAACSCVQATPTEQAELAELVAVGTITEHEEPAGATWTTDDATWTVQLAEIYKGSADTEIQVLSAMEGASCGWDHVRVGQEIVVFARADGTQWRSNLCDGSGPATAAITDELATALGAPTAVSQPPVISETPAEDSEEADDDGGLPARGVVGVVFLVAAAALLVVGAARSRRRT